jgi:hypothetical protein
MSILRELHGVVSVEVLVHGVMLDLTLNILGHHALARLRDPFRIAVAHHQRHLLWPTNSPKLANQRSAVTNQQPRDGTTKNGFYQPY